MSSDKKFSPRTMPVISRESYSVEKAPRLPNWMDEFANNLAKQSVESKSKANKSIYDQISSIMGGKSKYPNVEAAVEDMKERSGMNSFLNKLQSQGGSESKKKEAQCCGDHKEVDMFKSVPQIKETLDNYIEDTNGNLPIPAIVEKIKSIHKNDVSDDSAWDNKEFLHYVNDKSIETKKKHPSENSSNQGLGKIHHFTDEEIDPSNSDVLHGLNPVSDK